MELPNYHRPSYTGFSWLVFAFILNGNYSLVHTEESQTNVPKASPLLQSSGTLLDVAALLPNDSIVNDQICPDFTTESFSVSDALAGKLPSRTLAVNLPRHDGRMQKNYDIPCNFKVKGSHGKVTNVGVRGIHRTSTPWNFDLSDSCSSFIKFRITTPFSPPDIPPVYPEVVCRIWKLSLTQQQPKLLHPIVWYLPHRKIGISFPPTNSSSWTHRNSTGNTEPNKYLQIVFTVSTGHSCSIRVQQYMIEQTRAGACNATSIPAKFRSCGVYRCSDHVHLMNQLGSWTYINWGMNGEFEEPRGGVLYSQMGDGGYIRRRTYWFTAAVRTSIVPILFFGMIFLGYKFFCVLYPSYPVLSERRARSEYNQSAAIRAFNGIPIDASNLRDSLSNPRSRQNPPRHLHLPGPDEAIHHCHYAQYAQHSNNNANIRAVRIVQPTQQSEDPPPAYDSLSPPSYSEATKV